MSWFADSSLTHLQRLCINVIKIGPVPNHIAIIMDGNRRFAKKSNIESSEGHLKGFDKLAETLQWCKEVGVKEVTVYAFSIENFKRSKQEVDGLMKLATEKFQKLLEEKERIMKEGVCIRVIGNLSLLSPELRKLIAKAMVMTRDNNRAFLNLAFAYTSRDEIAHSIKTVAEGVREGSIQIEDIDEDLMSNCLYTNSSPDPDVLLRTSGETRFSDFLLWQISSSNICFDQVLWPEFSIWHFLWGIFKYQRRYGDLRQFKKDMQRGSSERNPRVQQFLKQLHIRQWEELQQYSEK